MDRPLTSSAQHFHESNNSDEVESNFCDFRDSDNDCSDSDNENISNVWK